MDIINSSHSYATGGTSFGEFWSDPKRLAATLSTENAESCTTYNMLKVYNYQTILSNIYFIFPKCVICRWYAGFPQPIQMDKGNIICRLL
jgi:hypothetical protein